MGYETLKETAKFAHSNANLSVPKIALNIGGLGGPHDLVSMCGPSFGARFALSWPRAPFSKLDLTPQNKDSEETRTALAKALQIATYDTSDHPKARRRTDQQKS